MTKQHFEFLAKWIGLNTAPGSPERQACIMLATTAGAKFNARFDQVRFVAAVEKYGAPLAGPPTRGRAL
jgi:hypothetical protein